MCVFVNVFFNSVGVGGSDCMIGGYSGGFYFRCVEGNN